MAQVFSTGAVDIHIASGGSANFLGHGEMGARISLRPQHEGIQNDLSGTRLPFDQAYMGTDAVVSVTLTRWNEPIRQAICAFPQPDTGTEGIDEMFDRGALLLHEERSYELLLVFPRATLPRYNTLRAGYRFKAAFLEGSTDIEAGTKPLKISVVWHCIAKYDPSSGEFRLFDFDVSAAGALD